MRTVHGTYRRKAKIPKDMISEITENPDSEIVPQIFGDLQSPGPSPEKQQKINNIPAIQQQPTIPKQESTPVKRKILKKILPRPPEKRKPPSKKTPTRNNNDDELSITPPQSIRHELDIAQSIKQELGLSSGITLQKIVRPSPAPILKGPPKLTYHGPKVSHFGAIEITPMKAKDEEDGEIKLEVDASNNFIPRLVKKPDPSAPSSSVINMNGKYSQKCQS